MIDEQVRDQMRDDWNRRAREDANYYVAFGRRDQEDEEFFATAAEVVHGLEWEMRRLPRIAKPRQRRALEVGCGPGRLIKPMSKYFGEIHGVDVSDEMIRLGREKLRGVPHAHLHATSGSDLALFADESFDFIYSYAVFQHIPSREVVLSYLREMGRVLKPAGIVRCQLNGLPDNAPRYDTWSGCRFSGGDIRAFANENGLQLLALEGLDTQYLWTSWRKPDGREPAPEPALIRRITSSHNSEPVAQTSGRFGAITIWMENLPPLADLSSLGVDIGSHAGVPCYIGPAEADGVQQLNVLLPPFGETGLLPVEVRWRGLRLCDPRPIRVIPQGPLIPRLISLTDGIDLLSGQQITTRSVKVILEEVTDPNLFRARVDQSPVAELDRFCSDPRPPRYEFSFKLPDEIEPGPHNIWLEYGKRRFAPVGVEVMPDAKA